MKTNGSCAISVDSRITKDAALRLYREASLLDLSAAADEMRYRLNPEPIVTYILDRNINYTNICSSKCRFCAFYARGSEAGYVIKDDDLFNKIDETIKAGGTQILLQGALNPELDISYYESLLKKIKKRYNIHLHALSPPEIVHIAKISDLKIDTVLGRLIDAGLDSIPGGGAEILADRVRQALSPNKCSADEWIAVMRSAHRLGLKTTATMMFGHIETVEERMEHLDRIRVLQDETGGFTAFIPWAFQPGNNDLHAEKVSALEYLRMLAVSRLYLDNVPHLQVSWVTQGAKVAEIALGYGADDFGSLMMEENVVRAAGVAYRMNEEEITRCISSMHLQPRRRNMYYEIIGEPLCQQRSE